MLKVTIREAILMTTIVAILLMWWQERNRNNKYDERLTAIESRLQGLPGTFWPVPVIPAQSRNTPAPVVVPPVTSPMFATPSDDR